MVGSVAHAHVGEKGEEPVARVDGTTQRRERGNGVVRSRSTGLAARKAAREEKRGGR